MALRHREFNDTVGVQFHPESIITDNGADVLQNFLDTALNVQTDPDRS
jgi:anthranilate/para-aminobenzoate synthase component II